MKTNVILSALAICSTILTVNAHDPELNLNPKWKECSFQLSSELTQKEWHQFASEAGLVTYFRPLTDARPMGRGKFELSVLQWNTRLDESDGAWNNTFVHPHETHWLIGGEELPFPGLTLRAGVTSKIDVGAYWTKSIGANYGVWGAQVQYNFLNDTTRKWSASARASFSSLYGPDDLTLNVSGIDLVASKTIPLHFKWLAISPYAGLSTYRSHAHEKSEVVSLKDENIIGVQGMAGAVAKISIVTLGVEYNMAKVNTFSYKVGVAFNINKKSS